jgi:hypothetical protein
MNQVTFQDELCQVWHYHLSEEEQQMKIEACRAIVDRISKEVSTHIHFETNNNPLLFLYYYVLLVNSLLY